MKEKFLTDKKELTCLLINIITIKMFFTYPRDIINNAGNAAWLQCLFVSLIAIGLYYITINIYKTAGMKSLISLCEEVGKKPLKIAVGVIIILLLSVNVCITLRSFPESVKNVLLPLTQMEIIVILLGVAVAVAALCGFNALSRIHAIYIPFAGIVVLGLVILISPYADVTNIAPLFGKGTYNLLVKGLEYLSIFSDILLLYIIIPFCKNFEDVKRGGRNAIIISAFVSCLIIFCFNLIYAPPAAEEFIFPVYQMTRLIRVGEFFQRLDAFFEFIWSIAIMLYAAVYIFVICYVFKEIFDLKYTRELIFPVTLIISFFSFIPSSIIDLLESGKMIYKITIPFSYLLPLIIPLIYRIKQKSKNELKDIV